jgi:hypothetical protein
MEWGKTGILECWKNGIMGLSLKSFNHLSHHSNIPLFQRFLYSSIPICFLCDLCGKGIQK